MPSADQHPVRSVLKSQGRDPAWLARQLGISRNYLHRILAAPQQPSHRPAPEWFYARAAQALGVPEVFIRPREEVAA